MFARISLFLLAATSAFAAPLAPRSVTAENQARNTGVSAVNSILSGLSTQIITQVASLSTFGGNFNIVASTVVSDITSATNQIGTVPVSVTLLGASEQLSIPLSTILQNVATLAIDGESDAVDSTSSLITSVLEALNALLGPLLKLYPTILSDAERLLGSESSKIIKGLGLSVGV
ncbi:hypothetical protein DL93DRAFT_2077912 [Clavulina sp. PMI_390]|nr:hypothetical protein DL93DRAFT_2077912 [Clavulina sp. PMI_390]